MNSIQLILLSTAVALSTFSGYLTDGWMLNTEPFSRKLRFVLHAFGAQGLMLFTGLWLGLRIGNLAQNSDYYISTGILLLLGIKVIFDSIRIKPETKAFDLSDYRNMVLICIAEGITPMFIAIAVGLVSEILLLPWFILVLGQFMVIITGVITGGIFGNKVLRFRTGPIGGLILLAAALKMLVDIIGY